MNGESKAATGPGGGGDGTGARMRPGQAHSTGTGVWRQVRERELIPNPLRTFEDWERFTHADIARLDDKMLLVELWRTQNGLADMAPDEDGWLWERWEALSRELRRRQYVK